MVVTKYLTVLSGKYPANLYRIYSAGCLNFTGYRIPVSGSGTSLSNNLLRADDIRLVGTTCYESVGLINLVPDLSRTGNKQCEHILLISCEIFTRAVKP